MGRLVYSMHVSLDGFIEDAEGGIDFSAPADDVHAAANEDAREAAALLSGRRLFEVMDDYWTAASTQDDLPPVAADFARAYVDTPHWVFSDIVNQVRDGVTIVRSRDAHDTVARLKDELDGPLHVGGAHLAASLLDLIDEFVPYVFPVTVGSGKRYWPDHASLDLRLADVHTFDSGVVRLRYVRGD